MYIASVIESGMKIPYDYLLESTTLRPHEYILDPYGFFLQRVRKVPSSPSAASNLGAGVIVALAWCAVDAGASYGHSYTVVNACHLILAQSGSPGGQVQVGVVELGKGLHDDAYQGQVEGRHARAHVRLLVAWVCVMAGHEVTDQVDGLVVQVDIAAIKHNIVICCDACFDTLHTLWLRKLLPFHLCRANVPDQRTLMLLCLRMT